MLSGRQGDQGTASSGSCSTLRRSVTPDPDGIFWQGCQVLLGGRPVDLIGDSPPDVGASIQPDVHLTAVYPGRDSDVQLLRLGGDVSSL